MLPHISVYMTTLHDLFRRQQAACTNKKTGLHILAWIHRPAFYSGTDLSIYFTVILTVFEVS